MGSERIWERSKEDLSGTLGSARCASSSPSAAVGRLTCIWIVQGLYKGCKGIVQGLLLAQRAFTLSLATQILLLLLLLLRPFRPSRAPFTSAFRTEGRFVLSDLL